MPILTGNTYEQVQSEPEHHGWFVGHFLRNDTPLKNSHVEVKWIQRKKGVMKQNAQHSQTAHSLIILLSGKLEFTFPSTRQSHILSHQGDYLYYDASEDSHESVPLEDSVAIEIRWPSRPMEPEQKTTQKSDFFNVAMQAAKNAEHVIMQYYVDGVTWKRKLDLSPVTVADTEAERVIVDTIKRVFPDHAFIGEESGSDQVPSRYQWIIDPIDGTKNFMRKVPLFGTQIALMEDSNVIVGVSNAPAMNEMLVAEKGRGAYIGDTRIHVSDVQTLSDAYASFGGMSYFNKQNLLAPLLKLHDVTSGHRGIGDCWSYHLLAQGKIDIMVEAYIKIWDVAALKIIVEEAGGRVTDIRGEELTKDSTTIIATNGHLHDEVVEMFRAR